MCNACGTAHPSPAVRRLNISLFVLAGMVVLALLAQPLLASGRRTAACAGEQAAVRSFAAGITADLSRQPSAPAMVARTHRFAIGIGRRCPDARALAVQGVAAVCRPCERLLAGAAPS